MRNILKKAPSILVGCIAGIAGIFVLIAAVIFLILLGIGGGPFLPEFSFYTDITPHWTPDGGGIVFGHGNGKIYMVKADGSSLQTISEETGEYEVDLFPSISPDGSRIAYATLKHDTGYIWDSILGRRVRDLEIETSALDGSDRRRLTKNKDTDSYPVWSPDGSKIAFVSDRENSPGKLYIYTMSLDGSDVHLIASLGGSITKRRLDALPGGMERLAFFGDPIAWSPDGSMIAFISIEEGAIPVIHTVGIDSSGRAIGGSGRARLGETIGSPAWSPDSRRVAFVRREDGPEPMRLYTMDPDGSDPHEVFSFREEGLSNISWSPDGSEILVGSMSIRVDGSALRRLPAPRLYGQQRNSWSPDGSMIAAAVSYSRTITEVWESLGPEDEYGVRHEGDMGLDVIARGSNRQVLVGRDDEGSPLAARGRLQAGDQTEYTVYFDGSGPPPAPFYVAQCSNGVAVRRPASNPLLVRDCETLLRIRDHLRANPPLNWATDTYIWDWEGVGLGETQPLAVESLRLSQRDLIGVIPAEIGLLSGLRELDLSYNWLSGGVPAELGMLPELGILNLSHNRLVGPVPAELGGLLRLKTLSLGYNRLSGSIPLELSGLAVLEWLYLSENRLIGPIPAELQGLLLLRILDLSHNDLSGPIPPEIGRLIRLQKLLLSSNRLSGAIPFELGNLSELEQLDVSFNNMSVHLPLEWLEESSLRILDLDGISVSGCEPWGSSQSARIRVDVPLTLC